VTVAARNALRSILVAGAMAMAVVPAFPARAGEPHPLELTAFGGYRLGGRLEVEDGRLVMKSAASIGGVLGYRVSPDALLELTYAQQGTELEFQPTESGDNVLVTDIVVRSLYLGGVYEHGLGRVHPFAGLAAGLTRLEPELDSADEETRFSFHFSGGVRTDLSDRVGLKFTVRGLFSTPPDDGSTILCTDESTCYVQSGNSLISQFDFSAGLTIRP
jgi:hypothetical protein